MFLLKLLIVDDEKHVRDGIEKILRINDYTDLQIWKASNGREALNLALAQKVDLIISDVRMPQINGLEMARFLRKSLPQVKLIFISAYSEIEYYRTAMQLHAVSFVEKPIIPEQLIEAVNRAQNQILLETQSVSSSFSVQHKEQLVLLSLLHQNAEQIPDSIICHFPTEQPILLFVSGRLSGTPALTTIETLKTDVNRILSPTEPSILSGMDGDYFIFLLSIAKLPNDKISSIAEIMLEKLQDPLAFITCAIADTLSETHLAFKSALSDQRYAFFYPHAKFYSSCMHANIFQSPINVCSAELLEKLSQCVVTVNSQKAKQLMKHALRQLLPPAVSEPEDVWLSALRLVNALEKLLIRVGVKGYQKSVLKDFTALNSYGCVEQHMVSCIEEGFKELEKIDGAGRCIYLIKREIETHYANPDFSVSYLADKFQMSGNYIGNYFKKRTGTTITNYLNTVRMEQAKRLLSDPTNRVNEVSCLIGIRNTDYFTRRFKQYTGKTPSEYRR